MKRCIHCKKLVWTASFELMNYIGPLSDVTKVGHLECFEAYYFPSLGAPDYRGCP